MFAADDGLISGNPTLADVLFLVAAVLFLLQALIVGSQKPDPAKGVLVPLGLTLVAVAWLVL